MGRSKSEKDKELADRAKLARAWHAWHREQLKEALEGVHRDVFERLMARLKDLRSARELVDAVGREDWGAVSADERLEALHQINLAICALRERQELTPIDDPLPGQPENAFHVI